MSLNQYLFYVYLTEQDEYDCAKSLTAIGNEQLIHGYQSDFCSTTDQSQMILTWYAFSFFFFPLLWRNKINPKFRRITSCEWFVNICVCVFFVQCEKSQKSHKLRIVQWTVQNVIAAYQRDSLNHYQLRNIWRSSEDHKF